MRMSELEATRSFDIPTEPKDIAVELQVEVPDMNIVSHVSPMDSSIEQVMIAYQNANRYLDIVKEYLLTKKGMYFFSAYVHNLAHTMPVRFDKFGDILHTADITQPYPPTMACPYALTDMSSVFSAIFDILDQISQSLICFIKASEDTHKSLSLQAEDLLVDIHSEYENLFTMKRVSEQAGMIEFDKWVNHFSQFKSK